MTSKIFKNTVFAAVIAVLTCIVIVVGVLFEYFSVRTGRETDDFCELAVSSAENGYIETLSVPDGKRIYIVASDGTVLFDSLREETGSTYIGKEAEKALTEGEARSKDKAYGPTERTVRYAKRLSDGTVVVIAFTEPTVWLVVLGMSGGFLTVLVLAALLNFVGSLRASKHIAKNLNAIEPESYVKIGGMDELLPLFGKIEHQNRKIEKQMDELGRQRREFNDIIDNMNEGLIIIDDKKRILSVNSAALKILGAEMPKQGAGVFSLHQGEVFYDAVDEVLSGESSVKNIANGDIYFQMIANPVLTDAVVTGAVIVIIDVTEKEKLEVMRREFTSNVSHELKTPLTSIYGLSEILMSGNVEEEISRDFAKSIHDETGRMISLVNDILKLSQLDEGGLNYHREYVDLFELSNTVADRLKTTADSAGVAIEVSGEPVKVFGVYNVLEEIVYNLCDNSLKYNKRGGKVSVTVGRDANRAYVSVADTGIGIPEEALPRIFERFYRVDKSHSRKIGGTGLGLSIVKHAAAMHGAEISAESVLGEGTTITVKF